MKDILYLPYSEVIWITSKQIAIKKKKRKKCSVLVNSWTQGYFLKALISTVSDKTYNNWGKFKYTLYHFLKYLFQSSLNSFVLKHLVNAVKYPVDFKWMTPIGQTEMAKLG